MTQGEKFHKQYRIESGDGSDSRYATSDDWAQVVGEMTKANKDRALRIFVYTYPSGTKKEDNQGHYVLSGYCTSMATEIRTKFAKTGSVEL